MLSLDQPETPMCGPVVSQNHCSDHTETPQRHIGSCFFSFLALDLHGVKCGIGWYTLRRGEDKLVAGLHICLSHEGLAWCAQHSYRQARPSSVCRCTLCN